MFVFIVFIRRIKIKVQNEWFKIERPECNIQNILIIVSNLMLTSKYIRGASKLRITSQCVGHVHSSSLFSQTKKFPDEQWEYTTLTRSLIIFFHSYRNTISRPLGPCDTPLLPSLISYPNEVLFLWVPDPLEDMWVGVHVISNRFSIRSSDRFFASLWNVSAIFIIGWNKIPISFTVNQLNNK